MYNNDLTKGVDGVSEPTQIASGNDFVCPSDGYIRIVVAGVISFYHPSTSTNAPAGLVVNRSNDTFGVKAVQSMSIFVRKGQKIKFDADDGTSAASYFELL